MTTTSLPAPDVTDRDFWTSGGVTGALAPALARADAERGTPWPQALTSQYARFFRDGDRTAYESQVAARHARLTRATLAALADPTTDHVDEVVDGVVLLCEQSTWCWAAHDDAHERRGDVTPVVTEPYLDLGAGEVAAQLAWVDHLLGPVLDQRAPGVRRRVRHEARVRVLRPFTDRRDWWWLGVDHPIMNWSPWIQGNVLAANLALEDDPVRRWATTALVAEGIAAYWAALPDDGGVDEGYHYWWQGAARALEAQDLLAFAGIAPAAEALDRIRATVAFPHSMHLGGDWYVNVADGAARPLSTWPWNVVHAWALRVGDDAAARHAASYRGQPGSLFDERSSLPRAVGLLTAPWGDEPPATPPLVDQAAFPATGVAVARTAAGSTRGPAVAVKGGHNDENHNHVDVGSVVVALDGVPVVVDAGKPTYRAGTFGPDRYDLWVVRGDWHNVPRVRGVEQVPGREFAARSFSAGNDADPGRWAARMDLGGAYAVGGLEHWWREVVLDRAAETVTVEDTWQFSPATAPGPADAPTAAGPTAWHWLLAGDVVLEPGRALVRFAPTDDGSPRTLAITWDPGVVDAALDVRELDDPELSAVWGGHLTRLRLTARTEPPTGTFRVTMRPTGSAQQEVG
ncbi:heparinase II/III family protein [Promicromonospora thailandica]|uniref:Heparinase II/III-like protein n=1 Tax=Promicromonospora thailandica TaxID=765201 RepID=A0A9X2FYA5_9MICO|nr:heparinase II/III family protein [Promicromonospora thailandica]MCP2263590.1 Heparinase II/III-like protein [Promicromonospora thailandica]